MSRYAPNARALNLAYQLEQLAPQITAAIDHVRMELAIADSYPSQTPGASTPTGTGSASVCRCDERGGDGCDICTPVSLTATERAADKMWQMRSKREQIRDDIRCIEETVASLSKTLRETIGTRLNHTVQRCDGRPYEGSELPYTPHSRDPRNGWYKPECADAADSSGMCPACRVRCDRWRREQDMPPLAHARNEAA